MRPCLLLVLAAFVLGGCGGGSSDSSRDSGGSGLRGITDEDMATAVGGQFADRLGEVNAAVSLALGQPVRLIASPSVECRSSEDTPGGGPHEDPFVCLVTATDANPSGLSIMLGYDVRWDDPTGTCWNAAFDRISVNGEPTHLVGTEIYQGQYDNGQEIRGCF